VVLLSSFFSGGGSVLPSSFFNGELGAEGFFGGCGRPYFF